MSKFYNSKLDLYPIKNKVSNTLDNNDSPIIQNYLRTNPNNINQININHSRYWNEDGKMIDRYYQFMNGMDGRIQICPDKLLLKNNNNIIESFGGGGRSGGGGGRGGEGGARMGGSGGRMGGGDGARMGGGGGARIGRGGARIGRGGRIRGGRRDGRGWRFWKHGGYNRGGYGGYYPYWSNWYYTPFLAAPYLYSNEEVNLEDNNLNKSLDWINFNNILIFILVIIIIIILLRK